MEVMQKINLHVASINKAFYVETLIALMLIIIMSLGK